MDTELKLLLSFRYRTVNSRVPTIKGCLHPDITVYQSAKSLRRGGCNAKHVFEHFHSTICGSIWQVCA